MKLNKRLNLVFEVERSDGSSVYVHHTPIAKEIFRQHYELITVAMASLYGKGLLPMAASRVAFYKLDELIRAPNRQYAQAEMTLLGEIWRMTYVLVAGKNGYDTVPFVEALSSNLIDEDDADEVKNLICFFTAASWVHGRGERAGMYDIMTESGAQTTSSPCTEWRPSSTTSNPGASSGAMATA